MGGSFDGESIYADHGSAAPSDVFWETPMPAPLSAPTQNLRPPNAFPLVPVTWGPPAAFPNGMLSHPGAPLSPTVKGPRSMTAAVLLPFFLGPLGLFYVSARAALIMLAAFVGGSLLSGGAYLALLVWPCCIVWSVKAATEHNRRFPGPGPHGGVNRPG